MSGEEERVSVSKCTAQKKRGAWGVFQTWTWTYRISGRVESLLLIQDCSTKIGSVLGTGSSVERELWSLPAGVHSQSYQALGLMTRLHKFVSFFWDWTLDMHGQEQECVHHHSIPHAHARRSKKKKNTIHVAHESCLGKERGRECTGAAM